MTPGAGEAVGAADRVAVEPLALDAGGLDCLRGLFERLGARGAPRGRDERRLVARRHDDGVLVVVAPAAQVDLAVDAVDDGEADLVHVEVDGCLDIGRRDLDVREVGEELDHLRSFRGSLRVIPRPLSPQTGISGNPISPMTRISGIYAALARSAAQVRSTSSPCRREASIRSTSRPRAVAVVGSVRAAVPRRAAQREPLRGLEPVGAVSRPAPVAVVTRAALPLDLDLGDHLAERLRADPSAARVERSTDDRERRRRCPPPSRAAPARHRRRRRRRGRRRPARAASRPRRARRAQPRSRSRRRRRRALAATHPRPSMPAASRATSGRSSGRSMMTGMPSRCCEPAHVGGRRERGVGDQHREPPRRRCRERGVASTQPSPPVHDDRAARLGRAAGCSAEAPPAPR